MAFCVYCGRFWFVRTGLYVTRGVMGRSHNEVVEPIDLPCPTCDPERVSH